MEDFDDVIPYLDSEEYSAVDFVQDHAIVTVGDSEDDPFYCPDEIHDDENEPSTKRFKTENEGFDDDRSNDFDVRLETSDSCIPSLLNLNVEPPLSGKDKKNLTQKSPTTSPWESTNQSNGATSVSKDRRTRGSRWR